MQHLIKKDEYNSLKIEIGSSHIYLVNSLHTLNVLKCRLQCMLLNGIQVKLLVSTSESLKKGPIDVVLDMYCILINAEAREQLIH